MHAYCKRKLFNKFLTLSVCVLIFPVISCTNLVDDSFEEQTSVPVSVSPVPVSTSADNSSTQTEKIIYLKGYVGINTNATASELGTISSSGGAACEGEVSSARAALPVLTVDGTNYRYFVTATAAGTSDVAGEVDSSTKTFFIPLKTGYTWTVTAGVKKILGSSETVVLSAVHTQKITADTAELENCTLVLLPSATGSGSVSLSMTDASDSGVTDENLKVASFSVTAEGANKALWDAAVAANASNVVNKTSIQIGLVPSGVYSLVLTYKNSDGSILFSTKQVLNVYDGLTTDTWKNSFASSGSLIDEYGNFTLTAALVASYGRTQFYVGPTAVCSELSDSNGGSAYSPYETIQKALSVISDVGQSDLDYTIHVSGTFRELNNISLSAGKAKSLSIVNTPGKTASLSGDLNDDGIGDGISLTINTEVPVVLEGLTIEKGICGLYINNASADVRIVNCNIENNHAELETDGGGIKIYSAKAVSIEGGSISGNSARNGAGIYSSGPLSIYSGTEIKNNNSTGSGSGVLVKASTFTMHGGVISSNTAVNGAVRIYPGAEFIMENGEISNNIASGTSGAGVLAYGNFSMKGGIISGNEAQVMNAGGVYVSGCTFTMTGGEIKGNSAPAAETGGMGGGLVLTETSTFIMTGGKISGNSAAVQGGGIYAYSSKIFMSGTAVIGDESPDGNASTELSHSNTAPRGAGVLLSSASLYLGYTSYTSESENTPAELKGGILYNYASGTHGGAVYNAGTVVINSGTMGYNQAKGAGGAIYSFGGTVALSGTGKIYKNTAGSAGGIGFGTSSSEQKITITGGSITENSSTYYGGALKITASSTGVMTGGEIKKNNSAQGGSGVYNEGTFTMTGGEINGSTNADTKGIYNNGVLQLGGSASVEFITQVSGKTIELLSDLAGDINLNIGGSLADTDIASLASAVSAIKTTSSAAISLDLSEVNGITEFPAGSDGSGTEPEYFYGCTNLYSIVLPETITKICDSAFMNCSSLASLTIPVSVKTIDTSVCRNCTNLTTIIYKGTVSEWEDTITFTRYNYWNYAVPATKITCSDGTSTTF